MSPQGLIETQATKLFGCKNPVMLAGMAVASKPRLAAAVSNAGGVGVIGGAMSTPEELRTQIEELKSYLTDKSLPFGIDLLIPKVGGGARKTNYDYLGGKLNELIDITIQGGAKVFVSAVGLPPKWAVDKLHAGGVLYMNMIGHVKHVQPAINNGADLLCAQGGEGGGHTGDISTIILIPAVSAAINGQKSAFTGVPVQLVAAGGLYNGQSLAASLMMGASAVWIGTRFVLCEESGATEYHQAELKSAKFEDILRTTIYSGRPLHAKADPYSLQWENQRKEEMVKLQDQGIVPVANDQKTKPNDPLVKKYGFPTLMGKVAGVVSEKLSAKQIVDDMVNQAAQCLRQGNGMLTSSAKL